jgi:hypothetical protein
VVSGWRRGETHTHLCQSRAERVALAFESRYRPRAHRRTRLQIRTPSVRSAAATILLLLLLLLAACARVSHDSMQRIHVFLNVILLEQIICIRLDFGLFYNKEKR